MSDGIASFVRWQSGCRELEGYGISHGDTFYRGFRDYEQPHPCPNGLPVLKTLPSECEAHQRRIAKAKREIETHSDHIDWRERVMAAHVEWPSDSVTILKEFIERQYE